MLPTPHLMRMSQIPETGLRLYGFGLRKVAVELMRMSQIPETGLRLLLGGLADSAVLMRMSQIPETGLRPVLLGQSHHLLRVDDENEPDTGNGIETLGPDSPPFRRTSSGWVIGMSQIPETGLRLAWLYILVGAWFLNENEPDTGNGIETARACGERRGRTS